MKRLNAISAMMLVTVVAGLTGCGSVELKNGVSDASHTAITLTGSAYGGQSPIVGANIQLWEVGTSGYGSAARPLIGCTGPNDASGIPTAPCTGVSSGAGGNFSLTGTYNCPVVTLPDSSTADSYVYVTATGGNTGTGTNSASALMFALGDCQALQSTKPFIIINEVSTVASVWALQQFMATTMGTVGGWNIGTPLSNYKGLMNAFANVNLMTQVAGPGAPAVTSVTNSLNGSSITLKVGNEQSKVHSLGNILAYCVNSSDTGVSTISSACSSFFNALAYSAGTPADTIQAAYALAQNPYNVGTASTLPFSAASTSPPFQPALSAPPNDWTLALTYYSSSSSTISSTNYSFLPSAFALSNDSNGNIWFLGTNAVGEIAPGGIPSAQVLRGNLATPHDLAIDSNDHVWVVDYLSSTVSNVIVEYTSGGVNTYNVPSADTSLYNIGIDGSDNVFVSSIGSGKLVKLPAGSTSGTTGAEYTGYLGSNPMSIVSDSSNNLFVALNGANGVASLVAGTTTATYTSVTKTPTMSQPYGIALDANSVVWAVNRASMSGSTINGNYVTQLTNSPNTPAGNTATGTNGIGDGGISDPQFAAIDGANHLWVSNYGASATNATTGTGAEVSVLDAATRTPITNNTGYAHTFSGQRQIIVDQSGNVWVGSINSVANSTGSSVAITEIVGAAAPTYGPRSLAAKNNKIGVMP